MPAVFYKASRLFGKFFQLKAIRPILYLVPNRAKWPYLCCAIGFIFLLLQFIFLQRHFLLRIGEKFSNLKLAKHWKKQQPILTSGQDYSFRYDTDYNESIAGDDFNERTRKLPICLIIGVRKGGTRALLDALTLHPNIRAARREVHYFDKISNYNLGVQWYFQQMPLTKADQITIEKTPAYFVNSQVPLRVKQLNSNMKLILIVRNPVIRMISDFTQVQHTKRERNKKQVDFEDAIFFKNSTQLNYSYKPVRNSLYARHFKHWINAFPLDQILILDGDMFIKNPLQQLRLVEKFLGLPYLIRDDQLIFNKRKGFYCFRRLNDKVVCCLGETKGRKQVPVSDAIREKVNQQLQTENLRFFAQINRGFDWQ